MQLIMRAPFFTILIAAFSLISFYLSGQTSKTDTSVYETGYRTLFINVHQLEPGKVSYEAVAEAHAKDLAAQGNQNVKFLKYWVDKKNGMVYCLSSTNDTESIPKADAEEYGLYPGFCYPITDWTEALTGSQKNLLLDIHYLGAGKVSLKNAEAAHKKDLVVQQKYGVNFINYWVNEKEGVIICLSEAKDSSSVIRTHKKAHGLIPSSVLSSLLN